MQAMAEDGVHVQVDHHQVLLELLAAGHKLPALVEYDAAAVEHQLILASHQIGVGHVHLVV